MVSQLISLLMRPADIETYRSLGVEEDLHRYDQSEPTLTRASQRLSSLSSSPAEDICAPNRSGFPSETPNTPPSNKPRSRGQGRSWRTDGALT